MKKHLSILLFTFIFISYQEKQGKYICPPCDLPCDQLTFQKPGICPHCNMKLIINESFLTLNDVSLNAGSGVFLREGRKGKEDKIIKVFYHKPEQYSKDSKILMVIPGAGRNGDSYRDAWVEESEQLNILILSPMYDESKYPFEDYHLCGLISETNLRESIEYKEGTNQVNLDEGIFSFNETLNRDEWLFNDFDRIFDLVINTTNSLQTEYDIFGHSAGGQILHRLALFTSDMKVNRIIAANSGFYTLPDLDVKMPFGMQNFNLDSDRLMQAFENKLILLIGELDNENETGGTMLRSTTVDKQGVHRFQRAKYFMEYSKSKAKEINTDFIWEIEAIPNVGHDHRLMGDAAAKLLYE